MPQRPRVAGRVGEVDAWRDDPLAEASAQRASVLGEGEPVVRELADPREQLSDRERLEHYRVLAYRERARLGAPAAERRLGGRALTQ